MGETAKFIRNHELAEDATLHKSGKKQSYIYRYRKSTIVLFIFSGENQCRQLNKLNKTRIVSIHLMSILLLWKVRSEKLDGLKVGHATTTN